MHGVKAVILVFSSQRLHISICRQWLAIQSFILENQSFLSREILAHLCERPQSLLVGVEETLKPPTYPKKLVNFFEG